MNMTSRVHDKCNQEDMSSLIQPLLLLTTVCHTSCRRNFPRDSGRSYFHCVPSRVQAEEGSDLPSLT